MVSDSKKALTSKLLKSCAILTTCAGMLTGFATIASATGDTSSDTPAVTPYRPSVSTPAALSAPGWLEGEVGGQNTKGGDSSRQVSMPYTLKLAFTPDWGVRIGGNAFVRNTDSDGNRTTGFGDTAVVLKRRFAINDSSAFGLEAGANMPTAKTGLGSGKADYSLNGIYSADLGEFHTDLNLNITRQGATDSAYSRYQKGWAAALSHGIGDDWGIVGEFSGVRQPGLASTSQFLLAGNYNVSRSLVLDAGMSYGLNKASPDWSVFARHDHLAGQAVLMAPAVPAQFLLVE